MTASLYSAKLKYSGAVAEEYVGKREEAPTWVWEQEQVAAWARSRPAGSSVLDVPFGTGRYVPVYRAAGLKVRGCDISADMIAVARRELGEAFGDCCVEVADAEDMRHLADGEVDAVLCSRFIQWLPSLDIVDRILAEFARVADDELFLQLRIPSGAAPRANPLGARVRRALASPGAAVGRVLRRLRRDPSTDWTIHIHPEPEVLARARAHGWVLAAVSEECPSRPGLRFYRLRKG
ncbi:MAG: class I SAM-dependent methyltransferase [Phenylobacterium sp.]|uniref:class I SAM-dependent methyltransferase n=1 Tax=Phenylobacterium sp. TaxID=1871053 RepID=UPI001A4FCA2E|nr:class I SAM-dependent methyltransferase [Phenylobacterium sp.]MBL8552647.1 class I SAM-dependent methyltransferase [Phenylobacterium sp.]